MRTATSIRPLLLPAALMLAACDDSESPVEPIAEPLPAPLEAPEAAELPAIADARWADGYTVLDDPNAIALTPLAPYSYNRTGGRITIQRPSGTTGRYIVTFAGLSAALGKKSTVHVTGIGPLNVYCKPKTASLVQDRVEVRCLYPNGTPANSQFSVLVLRKAAGRAFAFANKPTGTGYAPAGAGSYNPAGTMRVNRLAIGNYQVLFNGLGAKLAGKSGHVQVNAVGTGNARCKTAEEWQGTPNLSVVVQCYTAGGQPVDAKFTVLVQLPSPHLAYAYANQPGLSGYRVDPYWSSNPSGGEVRVDRINRGDYSVIFAGVDPQIIELGNVQVTALGFYDNSHCTLSQLEADGASVLCYAANGTPVDVPFTILLGS